MSYVISSGTTDKVAVSENHLRTFDYSCSLLNHLSTEANGRIPMVPEPNTNAGVFTARVVQDSGIGPGSFNTFFIQNNDPVNYLLIDRIYVSTILISGSLPNPNVFAGIIYPPITSTVSSTNSITPINENRSINILPNASLLYLSNITPSISTFYNQMFLTTGITELLPQGSDGLILGFEERIAVKITNFAITSGFEVFIRFAIGDLEEFT